MPEPNKFDAFITHMRSIYGAHFQAHMQTTASKENARWNYEVDDRHIDGAASFLKAFAADLHGEDFDKQMVAAIMRSKSVAAT